MKIIDFGLSNSYKNNSLLKTPCGSPCYAAPEMLLGKQYNGLQIDIWSTGIILYAMVNGFLPFEDENNAVLYKKILECNLYYPYTLSDRCLDMINRILTTNPEKRITIEEIKEHSFYKIGYKYLKKKEINIDNNLLMKQTIEKMVNMNFSKENIFKNINENHHNNITTTFYLIFNSLKHEHYFKHGSATSNKDYYNSYSRNKFKFIFLDLMKEDRICIFNEEKMNKNKNAGKNDAEVESENFEKKISAENEFLALNSNRMEKLSGEKQILNSGNSKKIRNIEDRKNDIKFMTNITKKTVENKKKDDIYMKTEININNNIINDENQVIEPFYTVINTTEDNLATKNKIKKNTQKTLSLNLNSKNNFSNLVKTKKLADNYLSLGNKNDIQNLLLKKTKDKIQIEKIFNVKKDEKINNLNSPISIKKENKTATEIQQIILNKYSNYVKFYIKI